VRDGTVGGFERDVFSAVNGLPAWLERPLWAFQQVGNLAVAFGLVLLIAALLRRPRLAVAAVLAVVAKLGLERVVKSLVERRRPGSSIGDVVFHGDVPQHGLSFVSGHAVITTAMATALMAVLPKRWRPLPWVLVGLNGLGRVYVGAHAPLDVVGGCALGLVIGGGLYAWLASAPEGRSAGGQADHSAVEHNHPGRPPAPHDQEDAESSGTSTGWCSSSRT
jgi:undecaprenyl-diphosphatase